MNLNTILFIPFFLLLIACGNESTESNSKTDTTEAILIEKDEADINEEILQEESLEETPDEHTERTDHSFTSRSGKTVRLYEISEEEFSAIDSEEIDPEKVTYDQSEKPDKAFDDEFKGFLPASRYMVFYWSGYEEAGYQVRAPDSDPQRISLSSITMNITDKPVETPDGKYIFQSANDYSSSVLELFYTEDDNDKVQIQIDGSGQMAGLKYYEGVPYIKLVFGWEDNRHFKYFKLQTE